MEVRYQALDSARVQQLVVQILVVVANLLRPLKTEVD